MVTDVIITSLTNLFALFCSKGKVDESESRKMLEDYLQRHLGIRNREEYLGLFSDFYSLYEFRAEISVDSIVDSICKGLKSEFKRDQTTMVLLRLMEFCSKTPKDFDPQAPIFRRSAKNLGVDELTFSMFVDFVTGKESESVKLTAFDGFAAAVKTLWIKDLNIMVFSYDGSDASDIKFNDVPIMKGMFQVWDGSGILKSGAGNSVYYFMIQKLYNTLQSSEKIVFSGRDIEFTFPGGNNGLHNFSFDMYSGELIAIMGGSGAGKTTLVSLLNGQLKPKSGSITINGKSTEDPEVKSLIGFVPQDDLLIEELTVYQNLYYTAKLCFEGMLEDEIDRRVMKMLKSLGLEHTKDLKVGSPINKTISGGQRKRLNIALELIREPAVLFLDEPTSGLSSADTEKVVLLLKEQTYQGRLIVTNIHQPSSNVYKLFDRLWLLDEGGFPVYDGNPIEAITYFKSRANYADAYTSTCPTCGNVNHDILLNIISEKVIDSSGRLTDERKVTPQQWHKMYLETRKPFKEPEEAPVPKTEQKQPGVFKQWAIFITRNFKTKITNLQFMAIALLEAPIMALVCAFLTRFAPPGEAYSVMNNESMVTYMFMAVIVASFLGMSVSAEEIIKDRALLKREKFLRLSYHSYIWSKIALMALISLIQTFLFVFIGNTIMGISSNFLAWWGVLFTTSVLANLIGLLLSQCLNSVVSIYITIPILLIPQILLCGLVVDFNDLTPNSTTGNVPVIGNVIPSRWSYEAIAVTSFTGNDYEKDLFEWDKKAHQTQYYRFGFINELQSALETLEFKKNKGNADTLKEAKLLETELPHLAQLCGIEPFDGGYDRDKLRSYLNDADRLLLDRGNKATLHADGIMRKMIEERGADGLQELKRNNYNIYLETQVAGLNSDKTCLVVDGHIVPRSAFVYLTPGNNYGNAPFYSSEKILGGLSIPTLWFNIMVLLLMSVVTAVCLIYEFPARLFGN